MKIIEILEKQTIPLTSNVTLDEFTAISSKAFDYEFDGESKFYPWTKPKMLPRNFKLGVIYGSSGSGKSSLLKEFGKEEIIEWDNSKAIVSHFETPEIALSKLSAVGLNTIPSWNQPYDSLSTGEKFRAEMGRRIKEGVVIDEYTSVIDRNVAKATSMSLNRYLKQENIGNIVLSTCHEDIIPYLEPDWVINTDTGNVYDGFFFVREPINIEIYKSDRSAWGMFKHHHYLRSDIHRSANCWVAVWNNVVVGFIATIAMPNGYVKNAWRGHRLVILPDFQGMGIGVRLLEEVAEIHLKRDKRFYGRTAHPKLGYYMNNSNKWKPTSKNKKLRKDVKFNNLYNNYYADDKRVCFSYEFVGNKKGA